MKNKILIFLLCIASSVAAQKRTITGVVTSAKDHEQLIGATVQVKGHPGGTITDFDGQYTIKVPAKAKFLIFSYVGMKKKMVAIKGRTKINVSLEENSVLMKDVVVTALGIKREAKALSYARQKVDVTSATETASNDFASALNGIAGLSVSEGLTNTASSSIIIRGYSSVTGNNQPLFVIDGMPVENSGSDINKDGANLDYGSSTSLINPEDIANVEVLKGPNAAALYGSRAANGVVIITTKQASLERPFKVSVSSNTSFQYVAEDYSYQNSYGGGQSFLLDAQGAVQDVDGLERIPNINTFYRNWGAPMLGQAVYDRDGSVTQYLPEAKDSDIYTVGVQTTNSVSMEGGNKKNNYRFSYTNMYSDSPVKHLNKVNKHIASLNLRNTLVKDFTLTSNLSFINEQVDDRQYVNGSANSLAYQYAFMMRNISDDDLKVYKDDEGNEIGVQGSFTNPYWSIYENDNQDKKYRFNGVFNFNYKLNKHLNAMVRLSSSFQHMDAYEFKDMGAIADPNGMYQTRTMKNINYNVDAILTYNRKFHDFSTRWMAGATRNHAESSLELMRSDVLFMHDWKNIANNNSLYKVTETTSEKRINSVYGSLNLSYKNLAYLDLTARNDWSSTLPSDNNSYFYPSIGGSLLLSELFHLPKRILPFAKVRASYAVVGNDTQPYRLINYYTVGTSSNGYPTTNQGNTQSEPNLKPEETRSYEFGADLRFYNNRYTVDVTYYHSETTDQIIRAQVPYASGYTDRMFNAGKISNQGVEVAVKIEPIKTKDFLWRMNINYAQNDSKVVSLLEGVDKFKLNSFFTLGIFAEEGEPYGTLRGTGVKRDEEGRPLIDNKGRYIKDNDVALGNTMPDWTGSINNTFTYKGWSLSCLLDISKGGTVFSGTRKKGSTAGVWDTTLEGRDEFYLESIIYGRREGEWQGGALCEGVTADGTQNTHYISPQNYNQSTATGGIDEFSLYDASFVKLRRLSLAYNFPKPWLRPLKLSTAKVALTGRNLWTIYKDTPNGMDPQATIGAGNSKGIELGSLPMMANVGFDIRLAF